MECIHLYAQFQVTSLGNLKDIAFKVSHAGQQYQPIFIISKVLSNKSVPNYEPIV